MTCIVGIVEEGVIHMGADSAGVDVGALGLAIRNDRKVFTNGGYVMGFTTSFRMGQLLGFRLKPPRFHVDEDPMRFMVSEFVDAVRQCLKDGGYASRKDETESGGTFLVGVAGRLFTIYDDYQVAESVQGYAACGCGAQIALGSLFATAALSGMARQRLETALQAAEAFSAGVRGPFHFLEGGGEVRR